MRWRIVCFIAIMTVLQVEGQQRSASLNPPFGPTNHLVSPDGVYALFGNAKDAQLWLKNTRTGERRMVIRATVQTLTLDWSPNSAAFSVNDRATSDCEFAYIYDVRTLDRSDLATAIVAGDSEARNFMPTQDTAPHSYFHVIGWLNSTTVEVQLHGHTAATRKGASIIPGNCFDLRYLVGRDGVVQKRSKRVSPINDQTGCDGIN